MISKFLFAISQMRFLKEIIHKYKIYNRELIFNHLVYIYIYI